MYITTYLEQSLTGTTDGRIVNTALKSDHKGMQIIVLYKNIYPMFFFSGSSKKNA